MTFERILAVFIAVALFGTSASAQVVVYQDNFDNDGIDVNEGIGGGIVSGTSAGLSFVDEGDLNSGSATAGFARPNFSSINSFNLASGFMLELTYTQPSNVAGANFPPFPSNHFSLGLATVSSMDVDEFFATDSSVPIFDGIGFSLGVRADNVTEGLLQATLDTDYSVLANFNIPFPQTETFGPDPISIVLTVQADGSFDYTLGALSGSGTTTLNLDQEFFVRGRTQGSDGNSVQSITLTSFGTAVLKGDVNLDGNIDLLDVGPFVDALGAGSPFQAEADVNCDGLVDLLDVGPFVDLLSN